MGPTSNVLDHGAKALSALASILDANDEDAIVARTHGIVDPVGLFYRYGLPASLLHRRVRQPARTQPTREQVAR
jgi:F420-non-reducing hydrogenase small subunit